jgi:hypothetical protein
MALKKKSKFAQLRAFIKVQKAKEKMAKDKPKPKGNRSISRPATKAGAIPKLSLKQRALNLKGRAKAAIRNAPKNAKKVKKAVKSTYRQVDTKMERKALLNKAKEAVSKKTKSVGKDLKAQANFRLNKLTGTGTKGREKKAKEIKANISSAASAAKGKASSMTAKHRKAISEGLKKFWASKK